MPRYSYTNAGVLLPVAATDVLNIRGPRNGVAEIRRVLASGIATAAGIIPVFLIKRSGANTGGTSSTVVPSRRSGVAASDCLLTLYSANPTGVGTQTETFYGDRIFLNVPGGTKDRMEIHWERGSGPEILGNEYAALGCLGAAIPGGAALDFHIEYDER